MRATYHLNGEDVDWPTLTTIIRDAGLGQPSAEQIERAYRKSTHVVFACMDGQLIGAARALSDGVYLCPDL